MKVVETTEATPQHGRNTFLGCVAIGDYPTRLLLVFLHLLIAVYVCSSLLFFIGVVRGGVRDGFPCVRYGVVGVFVDGERCPVERTKALPYSTYGAVERVRCEVMGVRAASGVILDTDGSCKVKKTQN